jgi:outer membrane lipoprotein-sorting protein
MKNVLIHDAVASAKPAGNDTKLVGLKQGQKHTGIAHWRLICALALSALSALGASAPLPWAKEILTSVRLQQARQQIDLQGQLRENEKVIPFHLTQTGPVIRYTFSNPDEALQLRLGENDSRLEEVTRGGVEKITPAQFDHKVRGTGVSYEDLALKFLYWPNARVTGNDTIRTRNCWKLELKAPSRQSQYSNVFLWVDKSGGALMRMEGYDWNGQLAKRFEVVSAQKIEGRWFLKQMRIEEIQPGTGKVQARTYLEIKK